MDEEEEEEEDGEAEPDLKVDLKWDLLIYTICGDVTFWTCRRMIYVDFNLVYKAILKVL